MGYEERTWNLEGRQSVEVAAEPRIPIELGEGRYYVLVEIDPHHAVPMASRSGTIGVFGPIDLGLRAANLTVPWVSAPDLVRPGDEVEVEWAVKNAGNLVASTFGYRVVLERSRIFSTAAIAIVTGGIYLLSSGET